VCRVTADVVNVRQLAGEARDRKKKFSGSIEVLRFERTLELMKRQLRKTDNIARNDARLQSSLTVMYHEAKNSLKSTSGLSESTATVAVPSYTKDLLPHTSHCHLSQDPVQKRVTHDVWDSGHVTITTASMSVTSVTMPSSVVMATVAKVTTSMTTSTTNSTTSVTKVTGSSTVIAVVAPAPSASLGVSEAVSTSRVSVPLSNNTSLASAANSDEVKLTSNRTTADQPSLVSAVAVTLPTTAVALTSSPLTVITNKSTNSVSLSYDSVTLKPANSISGNSANSTDAITNTLHKSNDFVATLADAATVKSTDSVASTSARSIPVTAVTVTAGKSVDAMARSMDEVTTVSAAVTAVYESLPITSPVPLSNIKSTSTPQSSSPSPKGHVTFSDHITEIQPNVGSGGGVNGKPRRIPPAPPPRRAIKNIPSNVCSALSGKPRDRPYSAVEPLATVGVDGRPGLPTVNGVGRARPLSVAPLATVDSDSDSSVGTESQTGTIRRNTSMSADRRHPGTELQRNGASGRTPPPVPTRKTSSLTSSLSSAAKNSEGFLAQDVQYCNLHDVRQECARLELASSQQDGRPNGSRADGMVKCEETEIY